MSRAKCAAVILGRSSAGTGQTFCEQANKDLNSQGKSVYSDEQYEKFNAAAKQFEQDVMKIIEEG